MGISKDTGKLYVNRHATHQSMYVSLDPLTYPSEMAAADKGILGTGVQALCGGSPSQIHKQAVFHQPVMDAQDNCSWQNRYMVMQLTLVTNPVFKDSQEKDFCKPLSGNKANDLSQSWQ